MANLDAPNGFVPVRHLTGGVVRYTGGFTIDSAQASDIFLGDPVALDGTPTGDGNNIDLSDGTGTIVGVFAGCQYTAANGDVVWAKQWVSGTATLGGAPAEAFVYVDPNIVFSVQCDGTITDDDIGGFADAADVGGGNPATGVSTFEIASASFATTIAQWQILGLAKAPDGIYTADISSANPRLEVQIAESQYRAWPGAVS